VLSRSHGVTRPLLSKLSGAATMDERRKNALKAYREVSYSFKE
jgi:hypothetical protein